MSRGAPHEEVRLVEGGTARGKSKPPEVPKPASRSANNPEPKATTPKPHLHQPRPEFPFNYAAAQEARDRELRRAKELEVKRKAEEEHQRQCDVMAEREAAHQAEQAAKSEYQRQCEHMADREHQRQCDEMAERERQHQRALQQLGAERNEAISAAMGRLTAQLARKSYKAGQDEDFKRRFDHILNAPDKDRRNTQDTFATTESFGHKFHANGKPIPPPVDPILGGLAPELKRIVEKRAALFETPSDVSDSACPS